MIKNIIFDFDGVILDSVPTKTEAFRSLFSEYPIDKVNVLIEYHKLNGGISRYAKIQYFFETLLKEKITDEKILEYSIKYSQLTKEELSKSKYIINDSLDFIMENSGKYNMHIASGADENDLQQICIALELDKYFISIHGSPIEKKEIVKNIIDKYNYKNAETILIGDSINDYEASLDNNINFYAYNNPSLVEYPYIDSFKEIIL